MTFHLSQRFPTFSGRQSELGGENRDASQDGSWFCIVSEPYRGGDLTQLVASAEVKVGHGGTPCLRYQNNKGIEGAPRVARRIFEFLIFVWCFFSKGGSACKQGIKTRSIHVVAPTYIELY